VNLNSSNSGKPISKAYKIINYFNHIATFFNGLKINNLPRLLAATAGFLLEDFTFCWSLVYSRAVPAPIYHSTGIDANTRVGCHQGGKTRCVN
jgi:hypothetical protein